MEFNNQHTTTFEELPPQKSHLFSTHLWNIEWHQHFPCELKDAKITIELGHYEEIKTFIAKNFYEIYQGEMERTRYLSGEFSEAKDVFYNQFADVFSFRSNNQIVGFFLGNPIDWNSYYIRHCSILPSFQGKKIYQRMIQKILQILKEAGVKRIEVEVSPSNLLNVHVLNKLEFNISGMNLEDRWGALVRFTKYLNSLNLDTFLNGFCLGKRFQT